MDHDEELSTLEQAVRWVEIAGTQEARYRAANRILSEASRDVRAGRVHQLTRGDVWQTIGERYFLLLALAQVNKSADRLGFPAETVAPWGKAIRWLRDIEEHWEQAFDDSSRSRKSMREQFPNVEAQRWTGGDFDERLALHEEIDVAEIRRWLDTVRAAVERRFRELGLPAAEASSPASLKILGGTPPESEGG